jgi:hypothetical protein
MQKVRVHQCMFSVCEYAEIKACAISMKSPHFGGLTPPQFHHSLKDLAVVVALLQRRDGHDLWYCAEAEDLGVVQL